MAGWILVPCLSKLRSEFDEIAPKRDRRSDGTIGDAAHQASRSDHNDDEVGNVPIRDADKQHEVHAFDADIDFGVQLVYEAGSFTHYGMEAVVQFLLARCRSGAEKRLRYIIYNRRIWEASNGWGQHLYYGPNPHDHHAHFSSSYDTDLEASTASWHLEELTMALDSTDKTAIRAIVREELDSFGDRDPLATILSRSGEQRIRMGATMTQLGAVAGAVADIVPQDIDEEALAAALAARLPDDADDITADELRQAIVDAARELLGPPDAS